MAPSHSIPKVYYKNLFNFNLPIREILPYFLHFICYCFTFEFLVIFTL